MTKRLPVLFLSVTLPLLSLWLLWPQKTHAQSYYTFWDDWEYLINTDYITTTIYGPLETMLYTNTAEGGSTQLTLAEIQDSIGVTYAIASDDTILSISSDTAYGTGDWRVTVYYTDSTSSLYLPEFVAGYDILYATLPDDKYIESVELYTDIDVGSTQVLYDSFRIYIPVGNVAPPAPAPTPTPYPVPTVDPLSYTWGAIPTPIAIPTPGITVTLTTTAFWDISGYEYSFSVAQTVWELPYMSEIVQIAVFSGAVFLGFYVLLRLLGAQMGARTVATTIISSGQDQGEMNQQELNQRALEARNDFLQEERNRLLKDLGRMSQDRVRRGAAGFNRGQRGRRR